MSTTTLSLEAWHAIKAVSIYERCGRHAAMRYAVNHHCLSLYRLARQLDAVAKGN